MLQLLRNDHAVRLRPAANPSTSPSSSPASSSTSSLPAKDTPVSATNELPDSYPGDEPTGTSAPTSSPNGSSNRNPTRTPAGDAVPRSAAVRPPLRVEPISVLSKLRIRQARKADQRALTPTANPAGQSLATPTPELDLINGGPAGTRASGSQ